MRSAVVVGLAFALLGAFGPLAFAHDGAHDGGSNEPPGDVDAGLTDAAATVTGALQGKDGVQIQTLCTHCNSANIQVGGLARELVPIWLDEYPVCGGLATSMIFSVLPADTVSDAEVSKGPGGAGEPAAATGGVIRLTEAGPLELPRLDVGAEAGTYSRKRGTVRLAGPAGSRVAGSLVAGREVADPVDDDGNGFNDVGAVDRDFAEGRLQLKLGDAHSVEVGASWIDEENTEGKGAYDWIAALGATDPDPVWTREDHLLDRREYRAGWEWKLADDRWLDVRVLDANRDQTVRSQFTSVPDSSFDDALYDRFEIRETHTWGSVRFRQALGLKGMFTVGAEAMDQEVSARSTTPDEFIGPTIDEATDVVESRSGFFDLDYKLGSKWNLEIGARYDDLEWGAKRTAEEIPGLPPILEPANLRSRSRVSPRGRLSFRPADAWTLRLIGGTSFRAPAPIFGEVCCGQDYERNDEILSETSVTAGFEAQYQPSPRLRVGTYFARTEFDDHILRLVGWSFVYLQTITLANVPESRADTAQADIRWSPTRRLALDGSISWLSHHNRGDETVIVDVKPPSSDIPAAVPVPMDRIPYEPVRTGSLSATVRLPGESSVTAQAGYTGSMLIQQYDESFVASENGLRPDLRETPGFWMVNLSFRTSLAKNLELVGGVDNLTDRLQTDLGDPSVDYNWGPLAGRSWRLGLRYSQATF